LTNLEELGDRETYYQCCADIFPKTPDDQNSVIVGLIAKVEKLSDGLNPAEGMFITKNIIDVLANKSVAEAEIGAVDSLKS
jgi:hypothetical protein